MKARNIIAAIAFATVSASPAFAMVSASDLQARVNDATSNGGNVSVQVIGDTAYLTGWVEDSLTGNKVLNAAKATPGIDKVVDGFVR